MADEFNGRQRALLAKLLHNAQSKTSSNSLITELQRQKEKFPKKAVIGILQEIVKVDKIAETIYKEMIKEFKTDISASECLRRFLTSYEEVKYARKASTRQNIETINEDEEASVSKKIEIVLQRNAELRTSANESKLNDSKVNDTRNSSNSTNDSRASSNVNNSRASSNVNDSKRNNSGGKWWWCMIVHLEWENISKW